MNAVTDPAIPLTWLMLRTTGVVAVVLLSLSTVIGIASPALRSPTRRLVAISAHNAAATTGLVLLVGHIVLAVLDSYIPITPWAAVIPGVSAWEPLWVGVGTVAVDLLILLAVTTATRLRAPGVWKRVHLVAYAAVALSWAHALAIGSDAGQALWLTALVGLGAAVVALVFRQVRSRTHAASATRADAHPAAAPSPRTEELV